MKKPTIASLQKQLTEKTAQHDAEYRCRVSAVDRSNKLEEDARTKDIQIRQLERDHNAELQRERSGREDAQQSFAHFKGLVLRYFLVTSNPETQKNVDVIGALQQEIAISGPDFKISTKPLH